MQSLEEEMNRTIMSRSSGEVQVHSNPQEHHNNGNQALLVCMFCRLKKPEIAEIFDPSV